MDKHLNDLKNQASSQIATLKEYYTFDDVLILPNESTIEPGQVNLTAQITKKIIRPLPIMSAAMDRVTEAPMAIALGRLGGVGVLHRNNTIDEQVAMVKKVKKAGQITAAACGPFDINRVKALEQSGCSIILIDCAHGHNKNVVESARKIKKMVTAEIIVGNIATAQAAYALVDFADAIRVGVGPGSICTTRIVSGVGVPQLSAIIEVAKVANKYKVPVIADGGMSSSGDAAKALAAGASSLTFGGMLAGTDEAPGKLITKAGQKLKEYRGMGSASVLNANKSSDRYLQQGLKTKTPEGIEGYVQYRGSVASQIDLITGGLKIACGYVGAKTITEFQSKAQFIKITQVSLKESHPHHVSR